ncbi:MAG: Fe-S cluster assembly protein SufD [Rhodospirillales bacterium]|nr:Fe-S cluster assembly protein SufD [Rhodospirillales bacterium]
MPATKHLEFPYASTFGDAKPGLPGKDRPWLMGLRETAAGLLADEGLPSRRVEAWKYTSLNKLAEADLRPATDEDGGLDLPAGELPTIEGAHRLVFVNGRYRQDLSDGGSAPDGIALSPLAQVIEADAEGLEGEIGRLAKPNGSPTVNANTAFMADGCVIRVAQAAKVGKPIHLVFVGTGSTDGAALAHHPRNLFVAESESDATVIESHVGIGENPVYWANPVCEISVNAGAELRHFKIQNESVAATHLSFSRAVVESGGNYDSFVLTVGGVLSRNEIQVKLAGETARCRLNGAYLVRGEQHTDTTTFIDHAKANCDSDEVYKGVLDDKARGVFQGKILVAKDSQQTNGNQLSRAILLSDGAEVNTKPELEIYADDVKCSHGATAGELDDDSMFYMKARGIPENQARQLLIRAFVGELIDEIEIEPVREHLNGLVENWLENTEG